MQIEDMKVAAQKHQYPVTSTWAVLEDDRGLFWRQNKKLLTSEQADRLAEQIRQAALEHDDGPCHVCGVCFFWSCAEGVSLGDCIHIFSLDIGSSLL